MRKNLFKILLVILLFLPLFSFAALDLEYRYPELPVSGQTIEINTPLGGIIKYFVSWAIIIGAIIVFGSLIYAGILYLGSTGRPEVMSQAKSRIFNSFLGLTILLGSYLILVTINPELVVITVKKTPLVPADIILLSERGLSQIESPTGELAELSVEERIEKLVEDGDIYYLKDKIENLKEVEEFGEFGVTLPSPFTPDGIEATRVNFINFELAGIGFMKNSEGKAKVITYKKKDFEVDDMSEAHEFTSEGKIDFDTGELEGNDRVIDVDGIVKIIDFSFISLASFFDSEVDYINEDLEELESLSEKDIEGKSTKTKKVHHPPLSIKKIITLPGVYLYSEKPGEEMYRISEMENLVNIGFDDKTERIGIKNNENHDFIAVLHDDSYGDGKMRIFFEKRELDWSQIAGNIPSEEDFKPGEFRRIEANDIDKYGKLNKASSIYIKEISSDISTCEEVRLCTEKYGEEECLIYTPVGEPIDLKEEHVWIATSTLPIFNPQNIPPNHLDLDNDLEIEVKRLKEDGTVETKMAEFDNNIYSIEIKGNCLVALFENYLPLADGIWDRDTPGKHSQIFTKSDPDLTDNKICKCGIIRGLGFIMPKSCVSAIAIYPIKK